MIDTYFRTEDLIDRLNALAGEGHYVFRGYNTQEQLYPNVIRNNMSDVESDLLFQFERYGAQYINASNPVDFMSYAQHFGLSTRLLDFSYNPFVALYFALFSPKSSGKYTYPEDKEYYYIRYASTYENILVKQIPYLDEGPYFEINSLAQRSVALIDTIDMMFNKNTKSRAEYLFKNRSQVIQGFFSAIAMYSGADDKNRFIQENESKVSRRKILFIDPSQSNQRLIMQQGLFMFPYSLHKEEHFEIISNNSMVIKIHKSLREPLLRYLDTLGLNAFRLMPDLSSVCAAVERKVKDNRTAKRKLFKPTTT